MSAICGFWNIGGADADEVSLQPMLAQLERRGPDGMRHWGSGPVALGHTLLATTPESLVERVPLADSASGCTITADARLDNREELAAALKIGAEIRDIGDGELILQAYLRWGEECPARLLGDFAFAIWDPRNLRLFCARDHMGMRQFHYHHEPGKLFVFATDAEAVVADSKVPRQFDPVRICDAVDGLEAADLTSTWFKYVRRLPPAHWLRVDADGVALQRYWQLQPDPSLDPGSDNARVEAFLDVFTEAVRCRLRSSGALGSMLSGGLDSGAVTAVAARLLEREGSRKLDTFSAIGPDSLHCPETRAIEIASAMPGLAPHFVDWSAPGDEWGEIERMAIAGEPFDSHMTLIRAIYLSASRAGIKVMLDGVGSDSILNAGNRVAALLRNGRPGAALEEARGEARFWQPAFSAARLLAQGAWLAWSPRWVRRLRQRWRWRRDDRAALGGAGLANADFARRANLVERRNRLRTRLGVHSPLDPAYRLEAVNHPYLVAARERYDRVAAGLAIEPRDPFLDIRLIHLCISLPPQAIQSGGWPKLILRRAMTGMVPEEILWRSGKEHLGSAFTASLLGRSQTLASANIRPLRNLISRSALAQFSKLPLNEMDSETRLKLVTLSNWLSRNQSDNESFACKENGDGDD